MESSLKNQWKAIALRGGKELEPLKTKISEEKGNKVE